MDKNYLTFKISQSKEKTTKISDWNFVIVSELCLLDHSVLSLPCQINLHAGITNTIGFIKFGGVFFATESIPLVAVQNKEW